MKWTIGLVMSLMLAACACDKSSPPLTKAPTAVAPAVTAPVALPQTASPSPPPTTPPVPVQPPVLAATQPPASPTGGWRVTSDVSEMTDETTVIAMLESDGGPIKSDFIERQASLVLRCKERELNAYLVAGVVLDGSIFDSTTARVRFDTDSPQKVRTLRSDDMQALFFQPARKWIEQLRAHPTNRLTVEVPVFQGGSQMAKFDLTGIEAVAVQVLAACPGKKGKGR